MKLSQAQSSQSFLASGGSSLSTPNIKVHQVLGASFIGSASNKSVYINQGFLLPLGILPSVPTTRLDQAKIEFYPNPANTWIKISLDNAPHTLKIELRSIQDRQSSQIFLTNGQKEVSIGVAEMVSGIYALSTIDKSGRVYFQGLVAIINH